MAGAWGCQPRPCPADESSLKMNHVEHIPQTLASHSGSHLWEAQQDEHGADMLKADPRDTFFLSKFQWNGSVPIPDGIWGRKKGTWVGPATLCPSLGWRHLCWALWGHAGTLWASPQPLPSRRPAWRTCWCPVPTAPPTW